MIRYGTLIGVEEYAHYKPTPFAHGDCDLLYQILTAECDYADQHTNIYKISPNAALSPGDIVRSVRDQVKSLQPGDTFLFYFAGHGHYDRASDRAYLILPQTRPGEFATTALALDDLTKELRPYERVCFRILDACHSGLDVRDGDQPDAQAFLRAAFDASGWVTIAGCRFDEFSIVDPALSHGVFTYHLVDYIRSQPYGSEILPEMLKIGIVPKVLEHAARLGTRQTPTLNASISGNVSLATRRPQPQPETAAVAKPSVNVRLEALRAIVPFTSVRLRDLLTALVDELAEKLQKSYPFPPASLKIGKPTQVDEIPSDVKPFVISFIKGEGLQPRHIARRVEQEVELPRHRDPFMTTFSMLSLGPQVRKEVHYELWQDSALPDSCALIELCGDGEFIPTLRVYLYVVPLQLSVCFLACVCRLDWPPNRNVVQLVRNYYQYLTSEKNDAAEVARFALFVTDAVVKDLCEAVESRITTLEREMKAVSSEKQ